METGDDRVNLWVTILQTRSHNFTENSEEAIAYADAALAAFDKQFFEDRGLA